MNKTDNRTEKIRYASNGMVLYRGESERADGEFSYRWTDELGKRHDIYARTLHDLRYVEAEINRRIKAFDGIDYLTVTLNDMYEIWIEQKEGIRETTKNGYKYIYATFVQNTIGKKKLIETKRSDIKRFYSRLHNERRIKTGTLENIQNVIHQVYQMAVDEHILFNNPSNEILKEFKREANLRAVEESEPKDRFLTENQQERLLEYVKNSSSHRRWYPILIVLFWTGMRIGEASGLTWKDIDFDNELICVNKTLVQKRGKKGDCPYTINPTKTKAGKRCIPMTTEVKEALISYKKLLKTEGIECNSVVDGITDFVFLSIVGNVQQQSHVNRALQRIVVDYNYENESMGLATPLPHTTCHMARHSFATRLCEMGVNIKVAQELLGHSDIRTTMDIYTVATEKMRAKEYSRFFK